MFLCFLVNIWKDNSKTTRYLIVSEVFLCAKEQRLINELVILFYGKWTYLILKWLRAKLIKSVHFFYVFPTFSFKCHSIICLYLYNSSLHLRKNSTALSVRTPNSLLPNRAKKNWWNLQNCQWNLGIFTTLTFKFFAYTS